MASKFNRGFLLAVLVAAVAAAQLVGNASAATYVVGDSFGWSVPPNGPATYSNWASQHVFRAGDVLVFNFSTGQHDVAYVNRAAFDGCSSTGPISLATVGPANFTLNSTAGEHYYICTFGQHCSLGQKLAINVTGGSPTPAPAPGPSTPIIPPPPAPTPSPSHAPAPSPLTPPTPTPTPTLTPTPTPTPSRSPSASPAPTPAQGPSSVPSPTSPGGATSPPSPGSESTPGGEATPPSAPSSATIGKISAPLVVFMSIAFGLMI